MVEEGISNEAINFHANLNPSIWNEDGTMKDDVKTGLMAMADDFKDFLGLDSLNIVDITVSGSNAAYTYTPNSDVDLHLVVKSPDDLADIYRELFDAKKNLYNMTHKQTVKGYDVEFYVQDAEQPVKSMGIFSLMRDKWISFPRRTKAEVDDVSVEAKVESFSDRIKFCLGNDDLQQAKSVMAELRQMRKTGLDQGGEFSPENLAFKVIRTRGLLQKLYDHIITLRDDQLSVESVQP